MNKDRKPRGYWTYERCKEEALKYNSRNDFEKNSFKAHKVSLRNKWLDDVCSHMEYIKKPNGFWVFDKCKEEALKYDSRNEFRIKSHGAYKSSTKNKWLNVVCSHMVIKNNNQKRCIYSYEFSDNSVYVGLSYNINIRHSQHINPKRNSRVLIHIQETNTIPKLTQITEYVDVNDAQILEGHYVEKYRKNGWLILNIAKTGALGGNKLYWTKEKCHDEAIKYNIISHFAKKSSGAHSSAKKHNWLDDICSHMNHQIKKPSGYWVYNKCKEDALKYKKRSEYRKKSGGSYNSALKNNWLDDICSHMIQRKKGK